MTTLISFRTGDVGCVLCISLSLSLLHSLPFKLQPTSPPPKHIPFSFHYKSGCYIFIFVFLCFIQTATLLICISRKRKSLQIDITSHERM